jgi:hypothetical protein
LKWGGAGGRSLCLLLLRPGIAALSLWGRGAGGARTLSAGSWQQRCSRLSNRRSTTGAALFASLQPQQGKGTGGRKWDQPEASQGRWFASFYCAAALHKAKQGLLLTATVGHRARRSGSALPALMSPSSAGAWVASHTCAKQRLAASPM